MGTGELCLGRGEVGRASGRRGQGREEGTGLEKWAGWPDGPCSLALAWLVLKSILRALLHNSTNPDVGSQAGPAGVSARLLPPGFSYPRRVPPSVSSPTAPVWVLENTATRGLVFNTYNRCGISGVKK